LRHLERDSPLDPFLLAFDRDAERPGEEPPGDIPSRFRSRHARLFVPELVRLSRDRRVRVVHAHNLYSAALALSVRPFWKYKVILDLHGRIPEEYVYLGKGGPSARHMLNRLERWAVTRSDHVVVVSEKLRDYVLETYPVREDALSVIPCCADGSAFRWEPAAREATRRRMRFDEKLVCLHLGSFVDWYRPDVVVDAFERIRGQIPGSHLLVVTFDTEAARRYLAGRLPGDAYTLSSAKHEDVPALLNAADLGFLILPRTENIRTSSPTKFSEYLNCGLPVLISPDVGDFSQIVAARTVGFILDTGGGVDRGFLDSLIAKRSEIAQRAVDAGRPLQWSAHRDCWNGIIERLIARGGNGLPPTTSPPSR
jgi:glycosyltransferase involved in cell wall biosynthesis